MVIVDTAPHSESAAAMVAQLAKVNPDLARSFRGICKAIKQREQERVYQLEMWPAKDVACPGYDSMTFSGHGWNRA